uniref:Protein DPCD n=1 Tax=Tabanus bromius TaxID=304241 RepID=A0A0K8TQ81_TABBR
MPYSAWLDLIKSAEKYSTIMKGVRKIHYTFPDKREMVEEYSMDTGVVVRRAWKKPKDLLGESKWELELGEDHKLSSESNFLVKESETAPFIVKRITKRNIEWRIRNLPYPVETYVIEPEDNLIVVRTKNKKYFKKIKVEELDRCDLKPVKENISFSHQYNTLIILYKKPELVTEMEIAVLKELKNVETDTQLDELLGELMS